MLNGFNPVENLKKKTIKTAETKKIQNRKTRKKIFTRYLRIAH